MTKRRWVPHRQTYFPRLEPLIIATCTASLLSVNLLPWGIGNAAVAVALTLVIAHGRFVVWKRRHPIITIEQYFQAQREKAMWN